MKRNGLKVRLAACDTFRSGAVEQLKVHGKAVGVEVRIDENRSSNSMLSNHFLCSPFISGHG